MEKIIIVGGPTGTGKTKVAIDLAKQFNGLLVNADSTQVYKDTDVGTNKGSIDYNISGVIDIEESLTSKYSISSIPLFKIEGVPVTLLSFLDPLKQLNVFDWRSLALSAIKYSCKENKLPILVGGTGLYIDSLIKEYEPSNEKINTQLRENIRSMTLNELIDELNKIDVNIYKGLNDSDRFNRVRLSRALEKSSILKETKTEYLENRQQNVTTVLGNKFEHIHLYPTYSSEKIRTVLAERASQMVENGLVDETARLVSEYGLNAEALRIMGYKDTIRFIKNEITVDELKESIFRKHWQYFRRQRTWFEGAARGYKLVNYTDSDDAISEVRIFLENNRDK